VVVGSTRTKLLHDLETFQMKTFLNIVLLKSKSKFWRSGAEGGERKLVEEAEEEVQVGTWKF